MSGLVLQIQNDLVEAMKNRDELKLSVLRMLKAAMQMAQIEKGKDNPLSDDELLVIVRRLIKQRAEAAQMYKAGGAEDRAETELKESAVLEAYLPAQLSDENLAQIVKEAADSVGASGMKDMGKVMGRAVSAAKGRADGGRIKNMVQEYLKTQA